MADTVKLEEAGAAGEGPDISTIPGKIEAAEQLKKEGNVFFKAKEYKKAIKKYKTIFAYVRE